MNDKVNLESVVSVQNISKDYSGKIAVRNLSMEIPAGICFGLLGPNGAGKSTTLKMVYGVTSPNSGDIRVFGRDVTKYTRETRSRLGVMLQEDVMTDALTPRQNLETFGRYHLITKLDLSKRVDWVINFMELNSHADVKVRNLSGGFKRRLAAAMAILNNPELLILDEPTTGLDPAVRHVLWSKIRQLKAEGKTVLLTTHYMDEAERLCDQVMIMANGESVIQGHPRELIKSELMPEVAEFDCSETEEMKILENIEEKSLALRSGDRLMVFMEDATRVLEAINQFDGGSRRPVYSRPANLEDVFLSVTGLRLGEGQ